MVFGTELRQFLDIPTGESCALHQNVSLLLRRFTFQVIDYVHLVDVGSKHLHLQARKNTEEAIFINRTQPASQTENLRE